MIEYTEKIREVAKGLLEKGTVDVFIGYKKGSVPMMNEPVLIRDPARVDLLHWDSHCGLNLCNYLTKRTDKIGIVANGCNSRNIVTHIIENQIKREQLHIVGIPCTGMIDHRAVKKAAGGREILDVKEDKGSFTVAGRGFEETFQKKDFLRSNCFLCRHRNPVIQDEMIADPVQEQEGVNPYEDVAEIENKSSKEKWEYFNRLISPCIRCYACRNACPLCF
jgi:formate dehydrogenase subunit beta